MLDLETLAAESETLTQRSRELAQLLDSAHPVLDRSQLSEVLAESKRLSDETHRARRDVAVKVAAGIDPGVPIGPRPPIRRVRTHRGKDLDPLGGRSVVSPQLVEYWTHRRDHVFPAAQAVYRAAAERTPYSEPLVAASRGHIAVLRGRHAMLSEHGDALEAALASYDQAYVNLRQGAIDTQDIAGEAQERLDSLKREAAAAELGDGDQVRGFIGAVLSTMSDLPVDPKTEMPLVPAPTSTPVTSARSTQVRSSRQPSTSIARTQAGADRKNSVRAKDSSGEFVPMSYTSDWGTLPSAEGLEFRTAP
jgi:hypothetical protein